MPFQEGKHEHDHCSGDQDQTKQFTNEVMDSIAASQLVGVNTGSFPGKVGTPEHGNSKEQEEVDGEENFQQGSHFGFLDS